jgi:hypothetical protein
MPDVPDTRNNGKAKASTRAKNKNNSKNYDRLYPFIKKGGKREIEEAAAAAKESLNIYIIKAIYQRMEKEGWSHLAPPGEDAELEKVQD